MRRPAMIGATVLLALGVTQEAHAASAPVAALQIALRAHGVYVGTVDGVRGPLTRAAVLRFQDRRGLPKDGVLGPQTRRALGALGRPLLGQRWLAVGSVGWDVSVLEFRLRRWGLARSEVDGRFDRRTDAALRRFQTARGLTADGIAGPHTVRALVHAAPAEPRLRHVVRPGESFFSIAARYRVSPWQLAKQNGLRLDRVIVPGQRLVLPRGASQSLVSPPTDKVAVRAALDRWSTAYGVDPKLARALAWMESGFQQGVVSSVGAVGVMQLLPETWEWVDTILLGTTTPRTAEGNVQAGVRYLRWQLDQFRGDRRLALAGWYQGARAVRERGLFDDTKQFVRVVLALYGDV
jgi:soluble lytic murein transglycosylase-like protein